ACMQTERKLVTFELQDDKIEMARETISRAKIGKIVELVEGNALDLLQKYNNISFCFLDAEKEIYLDCYQIVVPKMVEGGILVADNVISHCPSNMSYNVSRACEVGKTPNPLSKQLLYWSI
ncbi:unnamed protein product, partial [marine sediment metagenome]